MEFSPLGERFFPLIDGGFGAGVVPAESSVELTALDFGVDGTNPGETGMLLFTDGTLFNGEELHKTGSPQANEAIVVRVSSMICRSRTSSGTKFVDDIVWAFENGITTGCKRNPPLYCPNEAVTRAQMATFLDRALGLPGTSEDFFTDDENSSHERAINRIAAAGITTGCGGGKYCPNEAVTRAQMATFLDSRAGSARHVRGLLHRRREQLPRAGHQPPRGVGHHDRMHGNEVLPEQDRDPRTDGRVPASGRATLSLTPGRSTRA